MSFGNHQPRGQLAAEDKQVFSSRESNLQSTDDRPHPIKSLVVTRSLTRTKLSSPRLLRSIYMDNIPSGSAPSCFQISHKKGRPGMNEWNYPSFFIPGGRSELFDRKRSRCKCANGYWDSFHSPFPWGCFTPA